MILKKDMIILWGSCIVLSGFILCLPLGGSSSNNALMGLVMFLYFSAFNKKSFIKKKRTYDKTYEDICYGGKDGPFINNILVVWSS